ncbi:ABC transporter permease [Streptomyces somaliensis]|uniref:ABC transporter permease n=1 Tax=Streptomyces somaliensis TaxID=78355 RepID=UPI0034E95987|nr:ABC transporter permease [Streptomyces somaliensis]
MALPFAVGVFLVDGVARQGGGALPTLVWVVPLGLLATLPVGAVIGSLVDSPRTVGLLMLPVMGLVAISGVYFPVSNLPEWLQVVGQVFPVYWLGLGLRSALLPADAVAAEVGEPWRHLETAGVLGAWAVAGLLLAPPVLRRMARRESGAAMVERHRKAMQRVG